MLTKTKVTISIAKEDFSKVERWCKATNELRSHFVNRVIKFWFKQEEEKELVERYKRGYQKSPEITDEATAMATAAAKAFQAEGLQ